MRGLNINAHPKMAFPMGHSGSATCSPYLRSRNFETPAKPAKGFQRRRTAPVEAPEPLIGAVSNLPAVFSLRLSATP